MPSRSLLLSIVPGVFVLDRITKMLIESEVTPWDNFAVIPNFFSIVHTQNRGAAFGILSEATGTWRSIFLFGLSMVVMLFVGGLFWQTLRSPTRGAALSIGLALVLGGALGNLYDRILRGSVTDFLLFYVGDYQWPAFNVADSAISIGACLLLLDMWRGQRPVSQDVPSKS